MRGQVCGVFSWSSSLAKVLLCPHLLRDLALAMTDAMQRAWGLRAGGGLRRQPEDTEQVLTSWNHEAFKSVKWWLNK